jgi:hypothetical protein
MEAGAWGYNWITLSLREIHVNTGTRSSRLEKVGDFVP